MALYLIVVQAHFIMNNIFEGMIWFFLPVSLVIINDIFAYICGITFGKTQLIKLSPKKTVEGKHRGWRRCGASIIDVPIIHLMLISPPLQDSSVHGSAPSSWASSSPISLCDPSTSSVRSTTSAPISSLDCSANRTQSSFPTLTRCHSSHIAGTSCHAL